LEISVEMFLKLPKTFKIENFDQNFENGGGP